MSTILSYVFQYCTLHDSNLNLEHINKLIVSVNLVVENACSRNNGGCSHLCLPVSQNSRVCVCSDGFILQMDNTSCVGKIG